MVLFEPAGDVAQQQGDLIIFSVLLMSIIIVPVMFLTVYFAWHYRATNKNATYKPKWDHSTQLEFVIWAAPLLIVICLGAVTWVSTHLLDPYRPLARTAPGEPVAEDVVPLEVGVVALDWKWLFIYPEYGIATVNEFAAPIDRPIRFRISSSSIMNSFYIPALAGQVYAMAGMETKLHAVFNSPGDFVGFSANYSGHGFSNMRFAARSMSDGDFDRWVEKVKQGEEGSLDRATYLKLEAPSEKEPVRHFASVDESLFDAIVNMCVEPGKMCMHDMMSIDAAGGAGIQSIPNVREVTYDKLTARGTGDLAGWSVRYVAALCATPMMASKIGPEAAPVNPEKLRGAGLPRPEAQPKKTALADPAAAPRAIS